jgi:hypothetical protein
MIGSMSNMGWWTDDNIWPEPGYHLVQTAWLGNQEVKASLERYELINSDTMQWDEILLNDIFHPLDVARILQIPLSMNMDEDFVAWHLS